MPEINNRKRGFFTLAQNTETTDYVRLAYALALSLRLTQKEVPYLTVGITPGTTVDKRYEWAFDNIVEIPWGDHAESSTWKLENEWKSVWMSPYEETIKLDCDMLFFSDISQWWENMSLSGQDIIWANRVLNWRGETIKDDFYRKTFTRSKLPNIYTAMGYFKKTERTFDIFNLAKLIFWNWEKFYGEVLHFEHRPTVVSTDVVFAIAMKLVDEDCADYTQRYIPTFTHMKSRLQGWGSENISNDRREHLKVFFTPTGECRLGNHKQYYPLHYHVKEFLADGILDTYERLVKNV